MSGYAGSKHVDVITVTFSDTCDFDVVNFWMRKFNGFTATRACKKSPKCFVYRLEGFVLSVVQVEYLTAEVFWK